MGATHLKVGDKVVCRLFNSVEQVFYGESWVGEIVEISLGNYAVSDLPRTAKPYVVTRPGFSNIALHRKEIRGRV